MDRYIGKFLDNRYELLEVIGTGGMAVVYKARCHRLNRLVAVKILKQELAQDAEFRRRFHDESQAVAMLSHPNIVAVYDVSHSDDLDYIVMELIDGITLKQYMQKKGAPLNWREALHFITQIMRGLSHAHSRGIIHRDIKPHNIIVLRDGSVKVADFGIARLTSANQSSLTQEALGSVHYISPEQARGSHIDARSDIYSAGVVLYEMTTGRLPFEGESPVSVAIQHINSIPLSPRDINPDIPEALQEITMKAMCPDANERYLSADDMLTDLEEFRKNPNINFDYTSDDLKPCDEPTRPVPVGPIHPTDEHRREERRREEHRREDPPKPRQRRRDEEDDMDDYDDRKGPVWPILLAVGAIVAFIAAVIWFLWSSFFSTFVGPGTESFPVPDLQGMTLTEIRQDSSITDKFEIVEGTFVPSEEFEAGEVVAQEPKKDEMVKADEGEKVTITVDISSGGSEMTIPKVENMEQRAAMELLRDSMGLVVSQEMEANDEITKNYAIRTDLPEGTPVKRGDRVTLVISSGPDLKEIMVIPVTRMKLEDVRTTLEGMELEVGEVTEEPSETVEAGLVTWQSIPGGTKVLAGTAIDLRVSTGPETPSNDPDPSVSPDVSPSPDVTPTPPAVTDPPEPTPTQPVSGSKAIPVSLPAGSEDKSAVNVRIEVDGVVKHNNTIETGLFPISPRITGRGNQQVSVYVDDVLVDQYTVNFSE